MPKSFNQAEFDDFLEREDIQEIQKVPGFIWLLYTANPQKNEWLLQFWFTHQEEDIHFWHTLLRLIEREAAGLERIEKAYTDEYLASFLHWSIEGKVSFSDLTLYPSIFSFVDNLGEKDEAFWNTFYDLVGAIGWQRVKFYAQAQRLDILIDWVQTDKLSLAQVKEYDTVDSYQEKPLAPPAVDIPPPVEQPRIEVTQKVAVEEIDDDKTVVHGYRPPKNQTYQTIKTPPVAKKPADVPPKKPVIPPFLFKDYELCSINYMTPRGPVPYKLYLIVENELIKYRTNYTPGEEWVVLEGKVAQKGGELYHAIEEGKLRQLNPVCKKALLEATFLKGHTEETGQRRYERTVSRKLPHLLASDAFDNPERPLTVKERARFDMDEEDPRYHSSRQMPLGWNIINGGYNEFDDLRIASYLQLRYYEEYLEDFFDKVIIPLAEERVRLFDALKIVLGKIEDTTTPLSPKALTKLQRKQALLEEKIDVLSGCIKQQCCALKEAVVLLGEKRIHKKYYNVGLSFVPLKIYQQKKPKAEQGFEFKKDNRYRLQRLERLKEEDITQEKLREKVKTLDDVPLQPVESKINPLSFSQKPWKDSFRALAGVAYSIVTSIRLLPLITWEALKEWWRCYDSSFYPKVRENFKGTFFRTHSHQACFEAQKNNNEAFSPHQKALRNSDRVAHDNQFTFTPGALKNSPKDNNCQEFKRWEKGEHTRRAFR